VLDAAEEYEIAPQVMLAADEMEDLKVQHGRLLN
jgi:hypothetical protein